MNQRIDPLLKWPGGKQAELKFILPAMPTDINRYFEPFLGGGAVYFSIPAAIPAYVNDTSTDLICFYKLIQNRNPGFLNTLESIDRTWHLLNCLDTELYSELLGLIRLNREIAYANDTLKLDVIELLSRYSFLLEETLSVDLRYDVAYFRKELEKSISSKISRLDGLEKKNGIFHHTDLENTLEAAIKSSFYVYIRHLYNHSKLYNLDDSVRAACFFFLRENAYASMFRFNKNGHFNIPYGGISYNRKYLKVKIARIMSDEVKRRFESTEFHNTDFELFLRNYEFSKRDFIFLDPPYDSEFSDYDQNPFTKADQFRLSKYLINECKARFMLVIKYTPYIFSLYADEGFSIASFDKKYMYTVKERNNRDAKHLMITNY